jgi:hypothetical protein
VAAFKNRGHFCNYCRKILCNKIKGTDFNLINLNMNEVIWYAWDHPEYMDEILESFKNLNTDCTNKQFRNQLKALMAKYGFTPGKKTDYERKRNYEQKAQEERGNER